MKRFKISALGFIVSLFTLSLQGQEQPGIRDSLYSEILQEQRMIYVNLPETYHPGSEEKWDVIFVTDGEWNTHSVSFIHDFARHENFLPQAIIVGIPNTYIEGVNQRDRDFLPVQMGQGTISGRADQFLEFFRQELIPYISKKYSAGDNRTLLGHSFGGVFTMYALLTQPALFENYIATDPPFHQNNDFMNRLATEKLHTLAGTGKALWISGIESSAQIMGNLRMDSVLQAHAPSGLHWKLVNFPNETHNSVRLKGVYDGLKFAYEGFNSQQIDFHPQNGMVLKGKPFKIWLNADPAGLYYSADGSEPGPASAKMETLISLPGPAEFKVKKISSRGKWDTTVSGSFKESQPLAPVAKPKKAVAGGFAYSYFEGEWEELPDFKKLKPAKIGTFTEDFNINKLPRKENFALLVEGFLETEHDGYYLFGLDSDDGSRLYLGDQMLFDYDENHKSGQIRSFIVPLKAGFYPFRLEYLQKDSDRNLQLIYVRPNDPEQVPIPVPQDRQYSFK